MTNPGPGDAAVREFAARHGITDAQARSILAEHGQDESKIAEALRSLRHFFKAPS